jgi:hypothetical protein
MKIELLVTPGCPSRQETEKALKAILSELAPAASLRTIIVGSQKKAEALRFPGSPTVRIDGEDLEPEADKSLNYGLG